MEPEIVEWARLTTKELGATHYTPFDWARRGPLFYDLAPTEELKTVVGWSLQESKGPRTLPPYIRQWSCPNKKRTPKECA